MPSKKLKTIVVTVFLLLAIGLSFLFILNTLAQTQSVKRYLLERLSDLTGYEFRAAKIEINLLDGPGLEAYDVAVESRTGAERIMASRFRISLDLGELLMGRVVPTRILLSAPQIETAIHKPGDSSEKKTERARDIGEMLLRHMKELSAMCIERAQVNLANSPFKVKGLSINVSQIRRFPLRLWVDVKGNLAYEQGLCPFTLKGTVFQDNKGNDDLSAEMRLRAHKIPLALIPLPRRMRSMEGQADVDARFKALFSGPISIRGKVIAQDVHFVHVGRWDEKRFYSDCLQVDFETVYSHRTLEFSRLSLEEDDFLLSASGSLDFHDISDPHIFLEMQSPFMPSETFRKNFPTPLLRPWVKDRILPIITGGYARLEFLSLNGTYQQVKQLRKVENAEVLSIKVAWKDMTVLQDAGGLPVEHVSGKLDVEKGAFRLIVEGGRFGDSVVNQGSLYLQSLYGTKIFHVSGTGQYELHDLEQQRNIDLLPSKVRDHLQKFHDLSGKVQAKVQFSFKKGWIEPRIFDSELRFKECTIQHQELPLPLILDEVVLVIGKEKRSQFEGRGQWGNSLFHVSGSGDDAWHTGQASIEAEADAQELISLFWKGDVSPIVFNDLTTCRAFLNRERDVWSFRGDLELAGISMGNDNFFIDPPRNTDKIVFIAELQPGKALFFRDLKFCLGESTLGLAGSLNFKDGGFFDAQLSTDKLLFKDLGLGYRRGVHPIHGALMCRARVMFPLHDPSDIWATGEVAIKRLSIVSKALPYSFRDCDARLEFLGKEVVIHSLKGKLGSSPVDMEGHLRGWDGLTGDITVFSDMLNFSDLLPKTAESALENDASLNPFLAKSNIRVKLKANRGHWKKTKFAPAEAEGTIASGNLFINRSEIRIGNGVINVTGHIKRGKVPEKAFSVYFNVEKQPIHDFLVSLGAQENHMDLDGTLSTEGVLFMEGDDKQQLMASLTGVANFLIEEGNTKKSHVIFDILDFLSLQKVVKHQTSSDISKKGFYFNKLEAYVEVNHGIIETENLVMKSPIFNAAAKGKVDLVDKYVDYGVAAQPMETIDTVLSLIPVVGYILTGDDKSILVYYFEVKGNLFQPEVRHVPLKSLGSGTIDIFKRLLFTPGRLVKDISKLKNTVFDREKTKPETKF